MWSTERKKEKKDITIPDASVMHAVTNIIMSFLSFFIDSNMSNTDGCCESGQSCNEHI